MSLASDLIDDARSYAGEVLAPAVVNIASAMTILQGLGSAFRQQDLPKIPTDPPLPLDPGVPPQYTGPHFVLPFDASVAPILVAVPPFNLPADLPNPPLVPDYRGPPLPDGPLPDRSLVGNSPVIDTTDLTIPDPPDLLAEIRGIVPPTILPITIPSAPAYIAPSFDGVQPDPVPDLPGGLDASAWRANLATAGDQFRAIVAESVDSFIDREFPQFRTSMSAIELRLQTYLAGGTALKPEVEAAMYQRALDRNDAEARRAKKTVLQAGARAGYTIPPISLLNQENDLDQARRDNNARSSNEIMVEQAKLEQGNLQFAVTQATRMREVQITAAMTYYNGYVTINGQAIEYARGVADTITKAYGLVVQRSEIQARIFEAQANVYRARLEGALAVIRAYEAQVRGLEAEANVDRAVVDAYRARIDAVQAEANVFRAAADVVVARATVARAITEVFQARVQAYGAEVNARTAEFQGYVAATQGALAPITAAVEQVRGYQAQVQAYDATVRAKTTAVEAAVRTNESFTRVYATQIEAFRSKVQAESEAVRAEIASYDETIKAYVAKTAAVEATSRAQIASYEVRLRGVMEEAHLYLEQIREQNNIDVHRVEGMARVAVTLGEVYAALAQSTLSGMNSLAAQVAQE